MDIEQRIQGAAACSDPEYPESQPEVVQRFTIFLTDEEENDLKIEVESSGEEAEEGEGDHRQVEELDDDHNQAEESAGELSSDEEVYHASDNRTASTRGTSEKPSLVKRRGRRRKSDVNESVSAKRRKYSYQCPHCSYTSSWRTNLEKHVMAQHTGERPYHCPHCEYSSVHQFQLEKHWNNNHSGALIRCSICPFTADTVEVYWKHMCHAHAVQRSVSCSECARKSVSLSALEIHMLDKHKPLKQVYTCPDCGYRAAVEKNLMMHLQALHRCSECGFSSSNPREVRRHKKREHCVRLQPKGRPHSHPPPLP